MNIHGSNRYDQHGRKRKEARVANRRKRQEKVLPSEFQEFKRDTGAFRSKSASEYSGSSAIKLGAVGNLTDAEKVEVSKQYPIAPANNKGAYQVIPMDDIKHIGK